MALIFCAPRDLSFHSSRIFRVYSGGMAEAGESLLEAVRRHFAACRWTVLPDHVELRLARLGKEAGVVGAAATVRDLL